MKITKAERTARFYSAMSSLGFTFDEANKLRLIEKTLSRWGELECGGGNEHASWAIERDETTNKPFMVTHYHNMMGSPRERRLRIADREAGALRRCQQIMASHPGLWFYHQSDPRGCALYIGHKYDLENRDGVLLPIESTYTRGTAVCID